MSSSSMVFVDLGLAPKVGLGEGLREGGLLAVGAGGFGLRRDEFVGSMGRKRVGIGCACFWRWRR